MRRGNIFHRTIIIRLFLVFLVGYVSAPAKAEVKKYQFDIQVKNVSRLCHAKPIVTVNGMFPGPTIYAREGDRVLINVTNHAQYNMSIHWHGLKQYRNGWADGPAYITQCPVRTGQSYTYDFNVTGQRGTLWWHAHIFWLRATVYGAIVIMPKQGTPYPFPQPDFEFNLVLGEWWNDDVEEIVKQGNKLGLPPKMSDAHTINGKPGPLFPCSEKYTYAIEVEQGKTYLLRLVNAALNDELFFAIAGHTMTVVEIDAVYTKPFSTDAILIAPGQTTNVLVRSNQTPGRYFMAARSFMDAPISIDNKTATAILQYKDIPLQFHPVCNRKRPNCNKVQPNNPPARKLEIQVKMASGWGITGNKGRCYDFWMDFSECMSRCREPKDCALFREDYLECLHHPKEFQRRNRVYKEEQRQLRAAAEKAKGGGNDVHH